LQDPRPIETKSTWVRRELRFSDNCTNWARVNNDNIWFKEERELNGGRVGFILLLVTTNVTNQKTVPGIPLSLSSQHKGPLPSLFFRHKTVFLKRNKVVRKIDLLQLEKPQAPNPNRNVAEPVIESLFGFPLFSHL